MLSGSRITRYLLLLFLLSTVTPAFGQQDKATLRGIVTNGSGTPLARVAIDIVESETQVFARRVLTGNGGDYEAPYLKPGHYQLTIEQKGFETFVADDVSVDAGRVRQFDIALKRGAIADTTSVHD